MNCLLQIFKAQNIFEIKFAEVGDYNSINQDLPIPMMTSKRNFPHSEKMSG